jgi:hypothetical protein
LDLKFCKNLGFSLSEHCEWGTCSQQVSATATAEHGYVERRFNQVKEGDFYVSLKAEFCQ